MQIDKIITQVLEGKYSKNIDNLFKHLSNSNTVESSKSIKFGNPKLMKMRKSAHVDLGNPKATKL